MKDHTLLQFPADLPAEVNPQQDDHDHLADFSSLVTRDSKMRDLFRYAEALAASGLPVLVTGETGVGKDLMARAIHKLSGCRGEFVALNAAGLDDVMFSDALFGHHKGAYTGADRPREGLVARAAGGTLFLDEIADVTERSQIKLLRLLQEKEYYPLGSDTALTSNARIVLAANCDLQKRMAEGRFRNDLYYRLCSHEVRIPPLRDRKDDLPLLVEHFVESMSQQLGIAPPSYPDKLIDLLESYDFPGNVRELQGMVEDAVVCSKSGMPFEEPFLRIIRLAPPLQSTDSGAIHRKLEAVWGRFPTLREAEELLVNAALELSRGNQRIAATMLGLNRQTLNMRLKARRLKTDP